ncbi:MAG: helix-turn-helix transcriptional regulator [Oscillospiraceae bacterium]|nr:helix-turn-helix transcriptional regulator [Oscillospiraceae bacterium]
MDNKAIFSANLKRYMELNQKSRKEICDALGFNYYTFSDWVNGKKYPRMDKIERLAGYFGIQKSDLIEPVPTITKTSFSSRFCELVESLDITLDELQPLVDIEPNKLKLFLTDKGNSIATANDIISIAHVFNVSEAWLLGYDVPMTRPAITPKTIRHELEKKLFMWHYQQSECDMAELLQGLNNLLKSGDDLNFEGEPMTPEAKAAFIAAMELGMRAAGSSHGFSEKSNSKKQ